MERIFTMDAHAAGEPCRVVYGGVSELPGTTMADRRRALQSEWDWVRTGLTHEPRGHSGMFGAVLTPPVRPGSAYGLIFFDPVGYMDGCGHGTLCSVAVWRRLYHIVALPFGIDNPDDSVTRVLAVDADEEQCTVELAMPPATVLADPFVLPAFDGVPFALVHCGNTFVVAAARAVGIEDLTQVRALAVRERALPLGHAAQAALPDSRASGLEVLLYHELPDAPGSYATFVLFNGSQIDRSPCGTGSAALAALLLARGEIAARQPIRTVGPAGGDFQLDGTARRGGPPSVNVRLRGTAHITGVHEWIFSPADSFARGYLLA